MDGESLEYLALRSILKQTVVSMTLSGRLYWVQKILPEDIELVFLFANPSAPMPGAKRRKDGTKRSHGEWAGANGFRWYSEDTIPDHWIDAKARESDEYKKRNDKLKVKMQ